MFSIVGRLEESSRPEVGGLLKSMVSRDPVSRLHPHSMRKSPRSP